MTELSVEVMRPEALDADARALWTAYAAADPAGASPFLGLDYTLIAARFAPGARVAVVRSAGETVAFLPFQRRGGMLQPLGAPLTDYHGLIARPGANVDLAHVLKRVGAQSYRFSGLVTPAPARARSLARTRLAACMPDGFDAWYAMRRTTWGKYFKDKERAARSLERDHGPATYLLHDDDPAVLDWIIARKRAQYRQTNQHDVFACGWTADLLRALLTERTASTGARIATMRVDGQLAAAEYSLRAGPHNHFWFPVYAPEYARYSCGTLLSLQTLKLAAADGVTWADYGLDAEGYKKYFAEPVGEVLEGVLLARPALLPALDGAAHSWRAKAERRMAVIVACEAQLSRTVAAISAAAVSAAVRRMRPTAAA